LARLPLPLAYRRHAEQLGAQTHAGGVVTGVVVHAAYGGIRHLLRPNHILCAYLKRVPSPPTRDLVNGPLHGQARAGTAHPAVGSTPRPQRALDVVSDKASKNLGYLARN